MGYTLDTKTCAKCGKEKDIKFFAENPNHPSGYHSWCKTCYKRTKKIEKKKIATWFREYKKNKSCITCGENHPSCLELHHPDPSAKEGTLGRVVYKGWNFKRIKDEVKKCVILCSNCHRKFHWEELRHTRDIDKK